MYLRSLARRMARLFWSCFRFSSVPLPHKLSLPPFLQLPCSALAPSLHSPFKRTIETNPGAAGQVRGCAAERCPSEGCGAGRWLGETLGRADAGKQSGIDSDGAIRSRRRHRSDLRLQTSGDHTIGAVRMRDAPKDTKSDGVSAQSPAPTKVWTLEISKRVPCASMALDIFVV